MGNTFAQDVTEIATLLIGVALVALLVSHASGAAQLISTTSNSFSGLLRTVTLQSNTGNVFSAV